MTAFPQRCGRLDKHEPHEWQSRLVGANYPRRTFQCGGYVLIEGGYTGDADKAQDEVEEAAIRARREVA